MSDVFVLRLVTGETLITKVDSEDENMLHLTKPVAIFEQHDPATGKVGIAMADFIPYVETHAVFKSAISIMSIPKDALANNYREAVGDIILPPSQIQLVS